MVMNEKHYKCIEMLANGDKTITQISKDLGVSRQSIHKWLNDERFKSELDKQLTKIKDRSNIYIVSKLPYALEKLWKLTDSTDSRTARAAIVEFIDRSIGKVNTNITVEDATSKEDYSIDEALKRISATAKKDTEQEQITS